MGKTELMEEIELEMSNFDYAIDEGFEEALRENPNKVFGRHSGHNFNGSVWFDGKQFCEEVWVYGSLREVIESDTLKDLMNDVNSKYGSA